MATEPKPKAAKKKKRRSAPPEAVVQYVVAIEGWDWGYTLLLNDDKRPVDPYHEFRHLQIAGKLLRPAGLKTDRVEIALLPTTDMSEEKRKGYESAAISINCLCLDRFRKSAPPVLRSDAGQWQPWPGCGVTGRIAPTVVVGGFVKPRLPNPL
jgi:hypothetical protein